MPEVMSEEQVVVPDDPNEAALLAAQGRIAQLEALLAQMVARDVSRLPAYLRPLLERLPLEEAVAYLAEHGESLWLRQAPLFDSEALGERSNLGAVSAEVMSLAERMKVPLEQIIKYQSR